MQIHCPYCKANHTHLTLDANIRLTFNLDENGKPSLKPYWKYGEVEIIEQLLQLSPEENEIKIFCDNCGDEFIFADIQENGNIIPKKRQ